MSEPSKISASVWGERDDSGVGAISASGLQQETTGGGSRDQEPWPDAQGGQRADGGMVNERQESRYWLQDGADPNGLSAVPESAVGQNRDYNSFEYGQGSTFQQDALNLSRDSGAMREQALRQLREGAPRPRVADDYVARGLVSTPEVVYGFPFVNISPMTIMAAHDELVQVHKARLASMHEAAHPVAQAIATLLPGLDHAAREDALSTIRRQAMARDVAERREDSAI